jgi:hypothetical protein
MTHHVLRGRSEKEVLWFQRRGFLQAAASWTALGSLGVQAQARTNIVELLGDATLNGQRLTPQNTIQTGDVLRTGPQSTLTFVVGNSAFHVRQNSYLAVERGNSLSTISLLRLITGAVVSVFGKGAPRQIVTPTVTAGIRGTGVYTEVFPDQNGRSYLCNCYGTVDVASGTDRITSVSSYHQSFYGETSAKDGRWLTPAKAINHTDEELEYLARLANQRTAWQIAGKKGVKDGKGYMEDKPGQMHPAQALPQYGGY